MTDAAREVENFVEGLFSNVGTSQGTKQVSRHFIIAASGNVQFTTQKDSFLRKVASDTAQNAITVNGLTYTQLAAITAPAQLFSGVLVFSNVAVTDNINVFIPAGTKITVSVSSSGTQRMVVYFDEVAT